MCWQSLNAKGRKGHASAVRRSKWVWVWVWVWQYGIQRYRGERKASPSSTILISPQVGGRSGRKNATTREEAPIIRGPGGASFFPLHPASYTRTHPPTTCISPLSHPQEGGCGGGVPWSPKPMWNPKSPKSHPGGVQVANILSIQVLLLRSSHCSAPWPSRLTLNSPTYSITGS